MALAISPNNQFAISVSADSKLVKYNLEVSVTYQVKFLTDCFHRTTRQLISLWYTLRSILVMAPWQFDQTDESVQSVDGMDGLCMSYSENKSNLIIP
jgi:hypothetical protein